MSLTTQSINTKIVALEFDDKKIELLKNTVCMNATDDELELFLHVCNRTGLDPFRNQIYAIKRKGKMTIQTAIDGFRLIAERSGKYSPGREPTYGYDIQGKLKSATSFIKKQTSDGSWHEVSATAFWDEYVQEYNGSVGQFWKKMPHTMLAKVAEAIALRKAFPADLSGLYTTEEMDQADNEAKKRESDIEKSKELVVVPTEEVKQEVIVMPSVDMTEQEVDDYIMKEWKEHYQDFWIYIKEIKENKKWSYLRIVNAFEKHKILGKQKFDIWLMNKSGL